MSQVEAHACLTTSLALVITFDVVEVVSNLLFFYPNKLSDIWLEGLNLSLLLGLFIAKVKVLAVQLCPTYCNPIDCYSVDFSVHGILQARILEWVLHSLLQGTFLAQGFLWYLIIFDLLTLSRKYLC